MGPTPVGGEIEPPKKSRSARRHFLLMLCTALFSGFWARSRAPPLLAGNQALPDRLLLAGARYLAPLLIRSLENAAQFYRKHFGYEPKGKITVLIQDFDDSGYGGAGTIPDRLHSRSASSHSILSLKLLPSAERMGLMSRHELMHIVMGDEAAPRDATFRKIFFGKIMPNTDDPISIPFSFLGSPRVYSRAGSTRAGQCSWKHGWAAVLDALGRLRRDDVPRDGATTTDISTIWSV